MRLVPLSEVPLGGVIVFSCGCQITKKEVYEPAHKLPMIPHRSGVRPTLMIPHRSGGRPTLMPSDWSYILCDVVQCDYYNLPAPHARPCEGYSLAYSSSYNMDGSVQSRFGPRTMVPWDPLSNALKDKFESQ